MRNSRKLIVLCAAAACFSFGMFGCGRTHTTGRSDEKADGKPLLYTQNGDNSKEVDPKDTQPSKSGTDRTTGTDATGRPGGPSGGTVGAGAGSGTSGTVTGDPGRKPE